MDQKENQMPEGTIPGKMGFDDTNKSCAGISGYNQLPMNTMNQFSDLSVNGSLFGLQQSQVQMSKTRQELECSFKIVGLI